MQPQFVELNRTYKEIADISYGKLLVHSLWYSIQGEGPFAGRPAVFIRLAGCNRGAKKDCTYCDTDFRVSRATRMTVDDIVAAVHGRGPENKAQWVQGTRLVVITGGEPFLHDTSDLVSTLIRQSYIVQFESNGDLLREDSAPGAAVVVSPKIVMHTGRYARPPQGMLERADYLKVLVSADPENPYHELPAYLESFTERKGPGRIFISPINEYKRTLEENEMASMWSGVYDHEKCAKNNAYAAQLVMQHGYRLSLQMHTYVAVP